MLRIDLQEGKGPTPPAELVSKIFWAWEPEITRWQQGQVKASAYQHPYDARCFLESMHEYRIVFLQAAAIMRRDVPDHHIFQESALKSLAFLQWSSEVIAYIDQAVGDMIPVQNNPNAAW
jgi:hypothetical protein